MLVRPSKENYDFKMVYYNSDGKLGSMCGNGGRCISMFYYQNGLSNQEKHLQFEATDGPHEAQVIQNKVKLSMKNVEDIKKTEEYTYLNTGSPHHVEITSNIHEIDIQKKGQEIAHGQLYKEEGCNVNFVEKIDGLYEVRTYERGVEGETLSCGTGLTAVAITLRERNLIKDNEVHLRSQGGEVKVSFERNKNCYYNVHLQGPAILSFEGKIKV